jgi:hypothetical protein
VNLQGIERLQTLLGRIERNVKLGHTRTQGLGAFIIARAPAAIPEEPVVQGPVDLVEEIPLEDVSFDEVSAVELPVEDQAVESAPLESLPVESVAIEDVAADEIAVEITSVAAPEEQPEPAPSPMVAAPPVYTAPPSLDELTFSEPPPPDVAAPTEEIEPPPVSAAQAVSEPPDSIDAALLAATEAQANIADELDVEPPAVTPPPESGPQVAVPPIAAPIAPTRLGAEGFVHHPTVPTAEQLGEVIDLDQSSGPPLELAEAPKVESKPAEVATAPEELEFVPRASVPSRPLETTPPPARVFVPPLEPLPVEPLPVEPPPVAEVADVLQPAQTLAAAGILDSFGDEAPTASSMLTPETIARTPIALAHPIVDVIAAARAYQPQTFLQLLDASLGLLKEG